MENCCLRQEKERHATLTRVTFKCQCVCLRYPFFLSLEASCYLSLLLSWVLSIFYVSTSCMQLAYKKIRKVKWKWKKFFLLSLFFLFLSSCWVFLYFFFVQLSRLYMYSSSVSVYFYNLYEGIVLIHSIFLHLLLL